MSTVALRRWFERPVGGSWGVDPADGEAAARCIRGTDLVFHRLDVELESAPLRGFTTEDVRRRSLRAGDIVIEKSGGGDSQPVGRVGLFRGSLPALPTNFAARLRPRLGIDPRFASYQLASLYFAGRTMAAVKQTTGIQNLDLEALLTNEARLPQLAEQRAIADYLDAETARIDALIAKKQQLIHLLDERLEDFVEQRLFMGVPITRLDRMTDPYRPIMYGIVLPGPDVGDGVPIVKGGNVRNHQIGGHVCHTTVDIELPYARARLSPGDLVIIIRGAGAGRVGEVRAEHANWNITQDVARVAVARGVNSSWLRHVLESRPMQEQLRLRVGGAAITGINIWDLKRIEIPDADPADQVDAALKIGVVEAQFSALTAALTRQIDLLAEHRQALITAAVTGELAIPGAA